MSTHRPEPTYRVIASTLQAVRNCEESHNLEWGAAHTSTIDKILRDTGPDRNGIKEYLSDVFYQWLCELVPESCYCAPEPVNAE